MVKHSKKSIVKVLSGATNTKTNMYYTKGKVNAHVVAKNRKSGKKTVVKGSNFKREHGKLYYVKDGKIECVPMKKH